jgi:hypothetical protein
MSFIEFMEHHSDNLAYLTLHNVKLVDQLVSPNHMTNSASDSHGSNLASTSSWERAVLRLAPVMDMYTDEMCREQCE